MNYRFELERGSKKHHCPNCQKKTLVRYIDSESGNNYLPSQYGRCDREDKCGYHLNPYTDGYHKDQRKGKRKVRPQTVPQRTETVKAVSFVPSEIVQKHSGTYNTFATFLKTRYGKDRAEQVLKDYGTGTYSGEISYLKDAVIFWQRDKAGNVQAGKIMQYNPQTGKRVKRADGKGIINWIHKIESSLKDFEPKQCLFGEHLLDRPENKGKTVCIVESEKTAIIASLHFSECLWLATGGLSNLKAETLASLKGRKVVLIPDLSATDKWKEKARGTFGDVTIFDGLERIATESEKENGWDLADFLLQCPQRVNGLTFETETDTRYLSERPELFEQVDKAKNRVGLSPNTGSGKTTFAVEYSQRYIKQSDNCVAVLAFPLRSIAEQIAQKFDLPLCIGQNAIGTDDLLISLFGVRIVVTTYRYSEKLLPYLKERGAKVLTVVDEAHCLATKNFDKSGRDAVCRLADYSDKVLYLSGTFTPRFAEIFGCEMLNVSTKVQTRLAVHKVESTSKKERETLALANISDGLKAGKTVFLYCNSVRTLERINDGVKDLKLLSENQIIFNTSQKDENPLYTELIKTENVPTGVKLILTTAKLGEGVNITNLTDNEIELIYLENQHENFSPENLVQVASRFRNVSVLPVTVIGRQRAEQKPITETELINFENRTRERWISDLAKVLPNKTTDGKEKGLSTSFERSVSNRYTLTEKGISIRDCALAGEVKEKHHSYLTVQTGLEYANQKFRCIDSVESLKLELSESERERIAKGLESNSSKDSEKLKAIEFVANALLNPIEREYIFTYCVGSDFGLLHFISERFAFDKQRYFILKSDSGFNAFLAEYEDVLALSDATLRLRDFLTYLHYTDETNAAELVKTVTNATGRLNLSDAFSFAFHSEAELTTENALRKIGRETIADYFKEIEKYVGQEIGQTELVRKTKEHFGEFGAVKSERELLRLIKCAFNIECLGRQRKNGRKTLIKITGRKSIESILSEFGLSITPPSKYNNDMFSGGDSGHFNKPAPSESVPQPKPATFIPESVPETVFFDGTYYSVTRNGAKFQSMVNIWA